jgi:hypothetical protein
MDDVEKAIANLVKVGETQAENIKGLYDNTSLLAQAVRMRPTKWQTFGLVGVLNLITLLVVAGLYIPVVKNSSDTKNIVTIAANCLTPGQKCYEDGQKQSDANRVEVSLRSEYLRNRSELQLAQARGDDLAVKERQDNMAFYNRLLVARGIDIEKELSSGG